MNTTTRAVTQAMTNDVGRFQLPLTSGNYYIYLASRDNSPTYHSQVQVVPNQMTTVSLASAR